MNFFLLIFFCTFLIQEKLFLIDELQNNSDNL